MKKVMLMMAAGVILLIASTAKAQTITDFRKMTEEQKTELLSDSLKSNLHLDDIQYKQVKVLVTDVIHQISPVLKGTGDRMEKGHKVRLILEEGQVKLNAILTPEQSVIFQNKKMKLIAYYRKTLGNQPVLLNAPGNN